MSVVMTRRCDYCGAEMPFVSDPNQYSWSAWSNIATGTTYTPKDVCATCRGIGRTP